MGIEKRGKNRQKPRKNREKRKMIKKGKNGDEKTGILKGTEGDRTGQMEEDGWKIEQERREEVRVGPQQVRVSMRRQKGRTWCSIPYNP